FVNLIGNTGRLLEKWHLRICPTGWNQTVNSAGIISSNSFSGSGKTIIRYANTFVFSGNKGIGGYSPFISNSAEQAMKFTKEVTQLPAASNEFEGSLIKVARTTSKGT